MITRDRSGAGSRICHRGGSAVWRIWTVIACLATALHSQAAELNTAAATLSGANVLSDVAWPGGIAVLLLPNSTTEARYQQRRLFVLNRRAYVGVGLSELPGTRQITFVTPAGERTASFTIVARQYGEQRLTLADQHMVNPSPTELARSAREQIALDAARARYTAFTAGATPQWLRLWKPADGPLSSSFGSRRILNGEPRNPHRGLDIAAPAGARVFAPAAGQVALVGSFFFTGKTVLIDHGEGLVTLYAHLRRITVKARQPLAVGQQIGEVGATGRATGPHLHWAAYLNGVAVDPALIVIDRLPPQS